MFNSLKISKDIQITDYSLLFILEDILCDYSNRKHENLSQFSIHHRMNHSHQHDKHMRLEQILESPI